MIVQRKNWISIMLRELCIDLSKRVSTFVEAIGNPDNEARSSNIRAEQGRGEDVWS
jgi:hypothetical protein